MNAYIFDVDGVITSPIEKKITKPELIERITQMLADGTPVALISGRGIGWLHQQVISVLELYLEEHPRMDKNMLNNLYVSGEFSGAYAFHKGGRREIRYNPEFSIPKDLRKRLNKVAEKFHNIGSVEHEKHTQFTMEANSGKDYFRDGGNEIVAVFRDEIKDYAYLTASYDRIGINIKHKDANKRHAIRQYIRWMSEKNIVPEKFYIFGDSPSDLEMGEELFTLSHKVTFVFVGHADDVQEKQEPFELLFTNELYDAGTLAFLKAQK